MNKTKLFMELAEVILGGVRYASPNQTGGPIIKTGPTRGQNRSRNKNGRWRKKRSDAGKKRG